MIIFLLHCYSTAAMPYMGAEGGGAIVGVRLFLEFFSHVGFSSQLWVGIHVVGLFSPCGGPIFMWGPLFSLGRNGGGVVSGGGGFGIVLL